jgi:hypothetical protein
MPPSTLSSMTRGAQGPYKARNLAVEIWRLNEGQAPTAEISTRFLGSNQLQPGHNLPDRGVHQSCVFRSWLFVFRGLALAHSGADQPGARFPQQSDQPS